MRNVGGKPAELDSPQPECQQDQGEDDRLQEAKEELHPTSYQWIPRGEGEVY